MLYGWCCLLLLLVVARGGVVCEAESLEPLSLALAMRSNTVVASLPN